MNAPQSDFLVVGAGLVGLSVALKLQERFPGRTVTVLEKETAVGRHQSTHNSGVLHCGLYYKPGSLKARMAVSGIQEMTAFCRENGIAHEICGKVVVATNTEELPRLDDLQRRGAENGLTGLRRLSGEELREIEPHVAGIAGLQVPQEGIVDYQAVCDTMARLIAAAGGRVQTGTQVLRLRQDSGVWRVETTAGDFAGRFLVNCAGLHSDRICRLAGGTPNVRIIPFRGEYYKIRPERQILVRHLIYPVPDPSFPFLGVHFTRLIHGGVECGPNAVLAFAREGYSLGKINVRDLAGTLAYPGLWRFLRRFPSIAFGELAQSLSRTRFCRALQRLVPEIQPEDLAPGGAGVRAQAMTPTGDLVQDFALLPARNALHVLNAPSPAATASFAIGTYIAAQIEL
jgi:L-2-hydroxyglutarate oxidase